MTVDRAKFGDIYKENMNSGENTYQRIFVQHFQHFLRTKFVGYNSVHNPVHW